jgi:hypothetical protein
VKAFGGLSAATKKKLREIAVAAREGRFDPAVIGPRVKPGKRLIRVWQGETHSVLVLEDGFEWNGTRYRSLSLVAKTITGTKLERLDLLRREAAGQARQRGVTASAGSTGRWLTGVAAKPPRAAIRCSPCGAGGGRRCVILRRRRPAAPSTPANRARRGSSSIFEIAR